MTRAVWLTFTVAISAIVATISSAQTNSYISATDGFWDEARLWSLAVPPSITQSGIFITNAASVNVTIDSITASEFPGTMTISNLTIAPPPTNSSTLYLNNTGTLALHILSGLSLGPEFFPYQDTGGSSLISSNSAFVIDDGTILDNGTLIFIGSSIVATNSGLAVGDTFAGVSGFLYLSNVVAQLGSLDIGTQTGGSVAIHSGTVTLSGGLQVGDFQGFGSLLVADGALMVAPGGTGIGDNFGSMTISNATFLTGGIGLAGARGSANLSINNGTVTLSGDLLIGTGDQGSGSVSLNGGALIVTNGQISIGYTFPSAGCSLSVNGLFLARDIYVGIDGGEFFGISGGTSVLTSNLFIGYGGDVRAQLSGGQLIATNAPILVSNNSTFSISGGQLTAQELDLGVALDRVGTLAINDGSASVYGGIDVGDCSKYASGLLSQTGGQLFVTNSNHDAFINILYGELDLAGGTLQVDTLVISNNGTCNNQFLHTGGTLIVGKVVLDPNQFQIVSVTRQSNDVLVSWFMGPGATNALQVASGPGYSTNGFTDIFVVTNNTSAGVLTNYLDVGGATNKSRFYRARLGL